MKKRYTVMLSEELVAELDNISKELDKSRSSLIEESVRKQIYPKEEGIIRREKGMKRKFTISEDEETVELIDKMCEKVNKKRSQMIGLCIKESLRTVYVRLFKEKRLHEKTYEEGLKQ